MPTPQEKKLNALDEGEITRRAREVEALALELRPDAPLEGLLELIERDARRAGPGRGAALRPAKLKGANAIPIVAEGDSWFDYFPAGLDVIHWLREDHGRPIYKVAKAGDTLENMSWGTDRDKWTPKPNQLESKTIAAIRKVKPRIVLLSAGGNDFAGVELARVLNHKGSGKPAIRAGVVEELIGQYARESLDHIARGIWKEDPAIQIIVHGYAHPFPDGRPVVKVLGFSFGGPWLRPTLTEKRYVDELEARALMIALVDRFNTMVSKFASDNAGRVHYLDLRATITEYDQWENELHLTNSGFRLAAGQFEAKIRAILKP